VASCADANARWLSRRALTRTRSWNDLRYLRLFPLERIELRQARVATDVQIDSARSGRATRLQYSADSARRPNAGTTVVEAPEERCLRRLSPPNRSAKLLKYLRYCRNLDAVPHNCHMLYGVLGDAGGSVKLAEPYGSAAAFAGSSCRGRSAAERLKASTTRWRSVFPNALRGTASISKT